MRVLALTLAACGEPKPRLSYIQEEIFDRSCTFSSCHSALGRKGNLVLEEGKSYASLIDVPVDQENAQPLGWKRVVPFSVEESFLILKLTKPVPEEFDELMPESSDGLPEDEIDLIAT